jgi:hypothetical protein
VGYLVSDMKRRFPRIFPSFRQLFHIHFQLFRPFSQGLAQVKNIASGFVAR